MNPLSIIEAYVAEDSSGEYWVYINGVREYGKNIHLSAGDVRLLKLLGEQVRMAMVAIDLIFADKEPQ